MKRYLAIAALALIAVPANAAPRKFWTKAAKIALTTTVTLAAMDATQTCRNLANGGRELFLPSQRCAPIVSLIGATQVSYWFAAWIAHKHGHHKIERILQWVGPTDSSYGIVYSKMHGSF